MITPSQDQDKENLYTTHRSMKNATYDHTPNLRICLHFQTPMKYENVHPSLEPIQKNTRFQNTIVETKQICF